MTKRIGLILTVLLLLAGAGFTMSTWKRITPESREGMQIQVDSRLTKNGFVQIKIRKPELGNEANPERATLTVADENKDLAITGLNGVRDDRFYDFAFTLSCDCLDSSIFEYVTTEPKWKRRRPATLTRFWFYIGDFVDIECPSIDMESQRRRFQLRNSLK